MLKHLDLTIGSICTGGGLADVGAMQAGLTPIWGIELDPDIAAIAEANLNHKVYAQSCTETQWNKLDKPDVLWASPPCPSFSVAKTNRKETEVDRAIAQSIVDAIKTFTPSVFILENVQGYAKSKSLQFIEGALYGLGYWIDRQVLNSADFGVPQTRKRLILRAVRGGFPKPLPAPTRWKGWYEAIEDIIPTLPDSQFAPWQLERLPEELKTAWHPEEPQTFLTETKFPNRNAHKIWRATDEYCPTVTAMEPNWKTFLVDGQNARTSEKGGLNYRTADKPCFTQSASTAERKAYLMNTSQTEWGDYAREGDRPSYTVRTSSGGRSRALLVHPTDQRTMPVVGSDRPSFTITSNQGGNHIKSWLEQGRVVAMTARALARFQTLPDWYELPKKNTLACKIIGNGVPCNFAQAIVESCI